MKLRILAASFGATHLDTLEKTIQAEEDMSRRVPRHFCGRLWRKPLSIPR